jgi:hypothetical protein
MMKRSIAAAAMTAVSLHASAGWFDVSNYDSDGTEARDEGVTLQPVR